MLPELIKTFFTLGCIGFGGPQAHIAMMEERFVQQEKWLDADRFSEGLSVCNLLPGPTSTQMSIWLGYLRGGTAGAVLSGFFFILPAFLCMVALSWAYLHYGMLPQIIGLFAGIGPAVVAIILATCWRLSKTAVKDAYSLVVLLAAFALTSYGTELALVLLGAGLLGIARSKLMQPKPTVVGLFGSLMLTSPDLVKLARLGIFFLKTGTLLFGGGLVVMPLIQHQAVDVFHWMTAKEFLDGLALGQITPGPVVITATFVGYKVAGLSGAIVATTAIFLPSFLFILLAAPHLEKVRNYPIAQAFLKGVAPAVIGAILTAAAEFARSIYISTPKIHLWFPILICITSLIVLIRTKLAIPWLVLVTGLLGLALH